MVSGAARRPSALAVPAPWRHTGRVMFLSRSSLASLRAGGAVVLALFVGLCASRSYAGPATDDGGTQSNIVPPSSTCDRSEPFRRRPLNLTRNGRWIGLGVSYGPHRRHQRPGGPDPTDEQLLEDLRILAKHWSMLRVYSADDLTERMLGILRREKIPLKVMVGAWIDSEADASDEADATKRAGNSREANRRQLRNAVRLANEYQDLVIAVCVGNETQVSWTSHPVQPEVLTNYIRCVRKATSLPVTTADDFTFWTAPKSTALADEVDFIVVHAYAMWRGKKLAEALDFTKAQYAATRMRHPDYTIVLGEAGWATSKVDFGEQHELIKGVADEASQRRFFSSFTDWVDHDRVPSFYFEAFDEPWKGGDHPDEVEKHWGLYTVDRRPKAAVRQGGRGDLVP